MKELKKDITVREGVDEYALRLIPRCKWCCLFLLLLIPFLLLIPIKKTIEIRLSNSVSGEVKPNTDVYFQYLKRDLFSFESHRFFSVEKIPQPAMVSTTNSSGIASFNTKYQVYQWITSFLSVSDTARAYAKGDQCFSADSTYRYFNFLGNHPWDLYYSPKSSPIKIVVVDADDNNEPLPHAKVIIEFRIGNREYKKEAITNYKGEVEFDYVPQCYTIKVNGSKYGWYDDFLSISNGRNVRVDTLYLKQKLDIVKFFVDDSRSKEPLVGVKAKLFYKKEPNAQVGRDVVTNYKGIGKGVFDQVHTVAEINIVVNKNRGYSEYYDSCSLDQYHKWIKVEDWKSRVDSDKVICLRKEELIIPCNENVNSGNGTLKPTVIYLGKKSGQIYLTYKMHGHPDKITVYEGKGVSGKILFDRMITDVEGSPVKLSYDAIRCKGYLTVKIDPKGGNQGSEWGFKLSCPE